MKRLVIFLFTGFLILTTVFTYKFYVRAVYFPANPDDARRMAVTIAPGFTAADIAELLYEKGLIKSSAAFKFYLKQQGVAEKIKAGRMVLSPSQTAAEIAEALVEGRSEEIPVTIPEGWTAAQIADRLQALGITTAEAFQECLEACVFDHDFLPDGYREGYLYPDTYFVDPAIFSEQRFIGRMIGHFESQLTQADWSAVKNSGYTLEELVIMASIVEREERDPAERPIVAGVLWNRFNAGMGLAADATVLYALGRTKGGLTHEDLQINSLYNTRKYRGLPPTPISNPSISSLRAAISPKKTGYFYYLHDTEGAVHYAETLEGHNENKRRYIF